MTCGFNFKAELPHGFKENLMQFILAISAYFRYFVNSMVDELNTLIIKMAELKGKTSDPSRVLKYDICIQDAHDIIEMIERDEHKLSIKLRYTFLKVKLGWAAKRKKVFLFF